MSVCVRTAVQRLVVAERGVVDVEDGGALRGDGRAARGRVAREVRVEHAHAGVPRRRDAWGLEFKISGLGFGVWGLGPTRPARVGDVKREEGRVDARVHAVQEAERPAERREVVREVAPDHLRRETNEIIFIELMTSDQKVNASREGSK